jgi:hypothetical protein
MKSGEYPCWLCGEPVHQTAGRDNEWHWVGRDGKARSAKHIHHVDSELLPAYTGPAISHCDYPAYRRPLGWECRRCRTYLGTDAELGVPRGTFPR